MVIMSICMCIGVGSEFAVPDECGSDSCDWSWGRGVSVGVWWVGVGSTRRIDGVSAADDVRVASVLRGVRGMVGYMSVFWLW